MSVFGERHKSVALSYFSLGRSLPFLYYLNKAMEISESLELDSITAICYDEIGNYYSNHYSYVQAIDCYREALLIWQSLYGEIHYLVAFEYSQIANLLLRQGRNEESMEYCQKSLTVAREYYGEIHNFVAGLYCSYGMAFYNVGVLSIAIEKFSASLDIWQTIYGEEHPNVASAYMYLGHCYAKQFFFAQKTAKELQTKGIDIEDELVKDPYLKAKENYEKALVVYRNRDDNKNVLWILNSINELDNSFRFFNILRR